MFAVPSWGRPFASGKISPDFCRADPPPVGSRPPGRLRAVDLSAVWLRLRCLVGQDGILRRIGNTPIRGSIIVPRPEASSVCGARPIDNRPQVDNLQYMLIVAGGEEMEL